MPIHISETTSGKFANGAAFAALSAIVQTIASQSYSEATVGSDAASKKAIKKSKEIGEKENALNLEKANSIVNEHFDNNPDSRPDLLDGGLEPIYVHSSKNKITAKQTVGLYKDESGKVVSTVSRGETEFFIGSAPDVDTAIHTILHEYGHHTSSAVKFIRSHSGQSSILDPAEHRADKFANKVFKEIRGYEFEPL